MNSSQDFQSIWEYIVRNEYTNEFVVTYGPNGEWVLLFQKCEGYIKTELKQDSAHANRFITIDYWQSQDAFSAMKQAIAEEYDSLDKQCEHYITTENHLGYFNHVYFPSN